MTISELKYPKKTGTYADTLVAVGLASLVEEASARVVARVVDRGDHFVITCDAPFSLDSLPFIGPGYPFIRDKRDDEVPTGEVIVYEEEKARDERFRKWRKSLDSKARKRLRQEGAAAGLQGPPEAIKEIGFLKILASLRKGFSGDKQLYRTIIQEPDLTRRIVAARLLNYAGLRDEPDWGAEQSFSVSVSQIFNPSSGKGVHRAKPAGSTAGTYPAALIDWFEEWMKFRAAFGYAMLAYRCGAGGEDFKFFVLQPADLEADIVRNLRLRLRDAGLWGTVRLDVLACLTLAELLIEHSREYEEGQDAFGFGGRNPSQVMAGLHQAYFKSLGTAAALMNTSFLGLPGWLPISSRQDAAGMLEILREHRDCVRFLREDRSEEAAMLVEYRRFISSGDIRVFLEFLGLFAPFVMQKAANREKVKRFTTHLLGRLFMAYELEEIISNQGFQNIARAIRKATIVAQYRAANKDRQWEIQYGLAQRWKRRVKFRDRFIQEVSDFIAAYNYENARHAELGKEKRRNVTTEDLEQLIHLIDKRGSELVGMLLIGYGYAREPREDDQPAEVEPAATEEETLNTGGVSQ